MKYSKIYTGKGNAGFSRSVEGLVFRKSNDMFLCLSKFDTLHSSLGLALKNCRDETVVKDLDCLHRHLRAIMAEFSHTTREKLDAFIASESSLKESDYEQLRQLYVAYAGVLDDNGRTIDGWIDYGGRGTTHASASFDFATTMCREAEVWMYKTSDPRDLLCKYVNLLSKVLFILARNV